MRHHFSGMQGVQQKEFLLCSTEMEEEGKQKEPAVKDKMLEASDGFVWTLELIRFQGKKKVQRALQ